MNSLPQLSAPPLSSATDQVFDALVTAIISLEIPPGSKISEVEVAKSMGVSRQPVRDAFFRLSQQGFLSIKPQRATLVTKISQTAVKEAMFVRTAIEAACIASACAKISDDELIGLREILDQQQSAIDRDAMPEFHSLDIRFHQRICEISGHSHVWSLIEEQKAHMDRVRFFTLHRNYQYAYDEHLDVFRALAARNTEAAQNSLRQHIGRIAISMDAARITHGQYFEDE